MDYLGHTFYQSPSDSSRWFKCNRCGIRFYKSDFFEAFYPNNSSFELLKK